MNKFLNIGAGALLMAMSMTPQADASLTVFQTFTGNIGYSSDGCGSTAQSCTISASVPVGSTVLGAYLYSSTFFLSGPIGSTLKLSTDPNPATAVSYVALSALPFLQAFRADVTSIVAPIINGGPGGIYNFTVTETNGGQDGEALVVVYSDPTAPVRTVGILDGSSAQAGDTASINFATPLDPSAPGFGAEMIIGDGFSCCSQASTITVNGTTITVNAGNNDDGLGGISDGQLITVGSFDDAFSALLPSYANDHERYNLVPFITNGDLTIKVDTINPSFDDNIFLEVFQITGLGSINEPPPVQTPEPGSLFLLGTGLAAAFGYVRRKRDDA